MVISRGKLPDGSFGYLCARYQRLNDAFIEILSVILQQAITLPPSAMPSNGHVDHATDIGHGLVAKPSSPHKV